MMIEKTSSEIYGPVIQMIRKMKDLSPEEREALFSDLYSISEKVDKEFHSFDEEFIRIKNESTENEETIRKLNALIDKKMASTSPLDLADSEGECQIIYKDFWEKLDHYSQQYLIMANYLFKLFTQNERDFSPSVLEFGRAVENELVQKIYIGYVSKLIGNTAGMIDKGSLYGALKKAIKDYKGTVLIVSHEPEFYMDIADNIWNIEEWSTKII